jgi:outer membrane protein insertion porin family
MRPRTRCCVLLTLAAALVVPARAFAQQPVEAYLGRPVAAVHVEVEGRPDTSSTLLGLIDVHVGDPLKLDLVRASIAHLDSLGQFDDIAVLALGTTSGVEITFRLIPRHPIDALRVTGDTGLPAADLQKRVRDRFGGVPTGTTLPAIEETVTQLLVDEGYRQARVAASKELTHTPDRATLVLTINAGERATIARTDITGTSPLSGDTILDRTRTRPGNPYRPRDLVNRLTEITDDLRSRGYYEALALHQTQIDAQGRVDLLLTIDAGPRVVLYVCGPTPCQTQTKDVLPSGNLEDYIPIRRQGSADEDLLADSDIAIRDGLKREGYWKASVSHAREVRDGELVITFNIRRGARYLIDRVEIPETLRLPTSTIVDLMEAHRGDVFNEVGVFGGVGRVVDEYRRQGYYLVKAEPTIEVVDHQPRIEGEAWVVVHPEITEGPQGHITALAFEFTGGHVVSEADLRAVMRSRVGEPYVVYNSRLDQDALLTLYANLGFPNAAVGLTPAIGEDGRQVALTVLIEEGMQIVVGEITVVGNQGVSAQAIADEMTLRVGEPLGQAARIESINRLNAMGIFRRVQIFEEPRQPGEDRAHLVVSVEVSPATTIGYGGGVEVGSRPRTAADGTQQDHLEISPRGFFEIGRRNLGGRNRSLSLFARLSLKPRNAPGDPTRDGRGYGFNEYRLAGTYRERHAFRTDTDLLLGITSEQAVRTTFNFVRHAANAELLRRLTPRLSVSGRYALDVTRLFDERFLPQDQLVIDRLFPQVRLSILSGGVLWDRRDNPLTPTRGTLTSADLEVATRALGSEVGYAKTFLQTSAFHALKGHERVVLAGRAQLGLARGFVRAVPVVDATGQPVVGPDGQPEVQRIAELPASQRFYAGGGTTVRGFQLDRLGVPEILKDGLSLGGNAVVVFNAEVRAVAGRLFGRNLAIVGFMDGGNVFAKAGDLDLGRLRGTTGFGFRYDSLLGPLRLDFGFKLSRLQINGMRERGWELHLSIGEVF